MSRFHGSVCEREADIEGGNEEGAEVSARPTQEGRGSPSQGAYSHRAAVHSDCGRGDIGIACSLRCWD